MSLIDRKRLFGCNFATKLGKTLPSGRYLPQFERVLNATAFYEASQVNACGGHLARSWFQFTPLRDNLTLPGGATRIARTSNHQAFGDMRTSQIHERNHKVLEQIMLFHLLVLIAALALTSAEPLSPTATSLLGHGDTDAIESASASMPLAPESFASVLSGKAGQSLSENWDLPPGLMYCNKSSFSTINHDYVTTLVNGLYAGKANTGLLRAHGGELFKIAHKIGVLRGTQICKS